MTLQGKIIMKITLLYTLAIVTAVASATKDNIETFDDVEANTPKAVDKFFKIQPKQCNVKNDNIEEFLKACIKTERRWLHM